MSTQKFLHYLDPAIPLESRLDRAMDELNIAVPDQDAIHIFLDLLEVKDVPTRDHSIRVGLLARAIAEFMHVDGKALFFSGLLHDSGKAQTRPETLKKTEGWNSEDTAEIANHVIDGYRLLRGRFDFSAEVILWHHQFQPGAYPEALPSLLHPYSAGTKVLIPLCGRILAIADTFDALHRVNDRHGGAPITGEEIKAKMLAYNRDQKILVTDLFKADILTTKIFAEEPVIA